MAHSFTCGPLAEGQPRGSAAPEFQIGNCRGNRCRRPARPLRPKPPPGRLIGPPRRRSIEPVINGVHAIVFSPEAERVRAFFADTLGLASVDAGGGWLIFALPPAELAVHPGESAGHQLYLMCDDLTSTLAELKDKGVEVTGEVADRGWGLLSSVRLPDGSEFGIYQPKHPSPLPLGGGGPAAGRPAD